MGRTRLAILLASVGLGAVHATPTPHPSRRPGSAPYR